MGLYGSIRNKLRRLPPEVREVIEDILDQIESIRQRVFEDMATKKDMQEIRDVLKQLAEREVRSEQRLERLENVVAELAERQSRTEKALAELAERQAKTEERIERLENIVAELTRNVNKLTEAVDNLRSEIGGLARSVSYALENDAFRYLPSFLKSKFGIHITEKFIRTEIEGREINFLATAEKDGKKVVIVGEAVLKMDSLEKARHKFRQVKELTEIASKTYGLEAVPILVTHMAKREVVDAARKEGILVIQSFEWVQPEK